MVAFTGKIALLAVLQPVIATSIEQATALLHNLCPYYNMAAGHPGLEGLQFVKILKITHPTTILNTNWYQMEWCKTDTMRLEEGKRSGESKAGVIVRSE